MIPFFEALQVSKERGGIRINNEIGSSLSRKRLTIFIQFNPKAKW
jgi:hypothetical protein